MGVEDSIKDLGDGQIVKTCNQLRLGKGACATLVCRWIKYKMIDKDFWDAEGNERTPRWETGKNNQVHVTKAWAKKINSQHARYLAMSRKTENKHEKFNVGRAAAERISGNSDTWARSPARTGTRSNQKVRDAGIACVSASVKPGTLFPGNVDMLKNFLGEMSVGSTAFFALRGNDPKKGHAIAIHLHTDGERVSLYDPNIADLTMERDDFLNWWSQKFVPSWKKTEYHEFMSGEIAATVIKGHQELREKQDEIVYQVRAPEEEEEDPFAGERSLEDSIDYDLMYGQPTEGTLDPFEDSAESNSTQLEGWDAVVDVDFE